MNRHLQTYEIIELVMRGETHPHLAVCARCREEHEDAVALEQMRGGDTVVIEPPHARPVHTPAFRLAAQDAPSGDASSHVQRTWYFDGGDTILRVMKDAARGVLYGHVIRPAGATAPMLIRFSGLPRDFRPDDDGLFDIGPDSIEIERMDASLIMG